MNRFQKIRSFVISIIMITMSIILLIFPEDGYTAVTVILSLIMLAKGFEAIIYYFTMARYMVGGKATLFLAIILLDFGAFTITLVDIPHIYLALYLLGLHGLSGLIQLLRGFEARRMGGSWRLTMAHGAVNLIIAVSSCIFIGSAEILVYLYCTGLIYSAVIHIITSFRKTAIVYIQ